MAVIGVERAVKYSFVLKGMQMNRKGQYNAELTLSPRLYVKPLITPTTAIQLHGLRHNFCFHHNYISFPLLVSNTLYS